MLKEELTELIITMTGEQLVQRLLTILRTLLLISLTVFSTVELKAETLAERRVQFTQALNLLLLYKPLPYNVKYPQFDYRLAIGEVKRNCEVKGGHDRSTHKVGLAAHLIVYTPDYGYPHPEEETIYRILHIIWSMYGGAELIEGDLNHFSFEWEGVR